MSREDVDVVVEVELVVVKQTTKEMEPKRMMSREDVDVVVAEVPVATVVDLAMLIANLAVTAKMETRETLVKIWAETNQMKEAVVEDVVVEATEDAVEVVSVDGEVDSVAVDAEVLEEDVVVSVVDEEECAAEDAAVVDKALAKMQERAVHKAVWNVNDSHVRRVSPPSWRTYLLHLKSVHLISVRLA